MPAERCPVCGKDCIADVKTVLKQPSHLFSPCEECFCIPLDKSLPPPGLPAQPPCFSCGRRFIDDVFTHCHAIMAAEGVIGEDTPLGAIGTPLICPGISLAAPPFLPSRSLVIQTRHAGRKAAKRIVDEVPEVKGVILDRGVVPGFSSGDLSSPKSNLLLAGCDVRADIFRTKRQSFAVYKQQSLLHIEFPRGVDQKIRSVESMIEAVRPDVFIDAYSGAGTLGIAAALSGVKKVVLIDAWHPAAFWSAVNLRVNAGLLGLTDVDCYTTPEDMGDCGGIPDTPVMVAHARGDGNEVTVIWGDCMKTGEYLPEGRKLAALDIFGKEIPGKGARALSGWKAAFGGDAFIP